MPKRLQIAPHLPVAELERRYRQASEGIERSHYQIIWLLAQGRKSEDVATLTSYSRLWIYELSRQLELNARYQGCLNQSLCQPLYASL
jgi:hypothetical protein